MFDHVKFGASDYAVSKAFFLKALEPLGVTVVSEGAPTYGIELSADGKSSLCISQTDEQPAHLHLAFVAENRLQVDAFYHAALEAGGKDNGAPGLRPHYHANYYAAFVLGPDGHNIEVVCHEPDPDQLHRTTQELSAREPIFHRPEFGTSRSDFERMIADDFWEVGASGARYSREFILDTLEQRHASPVSEQWTVADFACRRVSADTYLVTYRLEQEGGRLSRRATLWQHSADGWKALYHQGTLIAEK